MGKIIWLKKGEDPSKYIIPELTEKVFHEWTVNGYGNNYTKFKCVNCGLKQTAIEDSPCTWLEFNKEPCIHG